MKLPRSLLLFAVLTFCAACSQATPPPAPAPAAAPAPAPCRLLMVTEAAGVTAATIGPRCPEGEWVEVATPYGTARSTVHGFPAQVTAAAGPGPATVRVSAGVRRE